MAGTKTSKRSELKENILAHKVEAALKWAQAHRPIVFGILGGIVFIGLFSSVVIIRNKERKELSWTLLSRANELKAQKRYDLSKQAYEDIITNSPQDVSGMHARYWLGEQALLEKNSDEAIEKFSSIVTTNLKSQLRPLALTNLAMAYEQKKDYQTAAETYQTFIDEYAEHFLAARNQLAWGRTLVSAGDNTAAIEILGQLVDLYPTSQWAENARETMDKIKSR